MHYFQNLSSASPQTPTGATYLGSRWGTFVPRPLICSPLEKILRALMRWTRLLLSINANPSHGVCCLKAVVEVISLLLQLRWRCRHHRRKEAFTGRPFASADLFVEPVSRPVGRRGGDYTSVADNWSTRRRRRCWYTPARRRWNKIWERQPRRVRCAW